MYKETCFLSFEIGRFISAFCGVYVTQIIDMKTNHGKMFAICRGGTHHFRLPVAQAHDHPIVHIPLNPITKNIGEEVSEEDTQKV